MPDGHKPIGVLMLDTHFPRPVGDIGNPATFAGPVIYVRIPMATVATVVTGQPLPADIRATFLKAARNLVDRGAGLITTSCGFLSVLQDEMSAGLPVPVVTSALCLMPPLRAHLGPHATIGIITFDADNLTRRHIPDAGPYVVEGLQKDGELYSVIAGDRSSLDEARAGADTLAALGRLLASAPDTTAIVLECTNLPPYRPAIEAMTRVPVFDIRDAIAMTQGELGYGLTTAPEQ
jgi:hypothetical protein